MPGARALHAMPRITHATRLCNRVHHQPRRARTPGAITQGLFDVVQLVGRLFLGSEIGGTGKAAKRDKSQSRKDRKESGANEQAQQRKEQMMGFTVVGLLLLLVLAGIYTTATAGNPSALPESSGSKPKSRR